MSVSDKNIPENFTVTERGVRKPGRHGPHSMAFPCMMSALKVYMGLEQRICVVNAHGKDWINDLDYHFHMGVSTEGFAMCYHFASDVLKSNRWETQPLEDCMDAEGFDFHSTVYNNSDDKSKIKHDVIEHLSKDLPVIVFYNEGICHLGIGYCDSGDVLLRSHNATAVKLLKNAKADGKWLDKVSGIIFIDGLKPPADRRKIILRSLKRAYEMLTETEPVPGEYGYGEHMYQKWIDRIDNDKNYLAKSNTMKYISPEKFDLAERRAYANDFFTDAENCLGEGIFQNAKDAFMQIHDKMWDITWMVTRDNEGKLRERETRNKIIEILKECQSLDLKAAENIKQVLDNHEQPDIFEPVRFDNHVNVIGSDGQNLNDTYLHRAKGLVKNGRAEWVDEKTIRMIEKYKYHCQHQAESFARAVIPVPSDYPLRAGLPDDFRIHFSKLCELAGDIYMDMAKQPEAYGLMLVDIESKDHNLARDGYRTIHRFVDTLSNLSRCSELKNHQLIVNAEEFKKSIKKGTGLVSGPVPKYELILSRLSDFGFAVSDFEGKPFGKKIEYFTVEYPDYPEMIDTIKAYCRCWDELRENHSNVKVWDGGFHHHYYRFDYKVTADHDALTFRQWVSDEADYQGYSPKQKAFSIAFYEESLRYKDVRFDGDYTYKSKRIARMCQSGFSAIGAEGHQVHIRLKNMDRYMAEIEKMPESIKELMSNDSCRHCNFQGATEKYCKFRVHWTFDGQMHEGCAHACFYFNELNTALVEHYWKLLELEYDLKSNRTVLTPKP